MSLVSAGLGIGFAPEWTLDLPNGNFELRKVRGRLQDRAWVAWSNNEPTAARDDIIDIARALDRAGSDRRGGENLVVWGPSIKRIGLTGLPGSPPLQC
ncbi:hypothetical protein [Ensifer canadensis]|uniref:hypothetical protein n=1 Tax=Ensifer canadensis TaxID=555315 RepID=UPI0035E3ECAB